jgi:uncharacterized protein with HEPN domain
MSDRNSVILLNDILESIQNIFEFTKGISFEQYCNDLKTRHAVEHNFMIIGEAVSRLPDDLKQEYTIINWRQVKDFRNVIVHDYFGIDNSIVWDIIQFSLLELLNDISQIVKQESGGNL